MTRPILALFILVFAGCYGRSELSLGSIVTPPGGAPQTPPGSPGGSEQPGYEEPQEAPAPPLKPAPARMHALTSLQLKNTLEDLFGPWASATTPAELDVPALHFASLGTTAVTLTGNTVEKLEGLALTIADRAFDDPARRAALVGCTPTSAADACVRAYLSRFGQRAWRRPLETAELNALVALSTQVSTAMSDPWAGPRYATAALLVSPAFLYRIEVAEGGRYSDYEMASRLAYAIWNSTPDEALLAAAGKGELSTKEQVRAQATRMLESPRARAAAQRYFAEYLGLDALDGLVKDTATFPRMTPTLGRSMRGELERVIDDLVLTRRADLRDLFTVKDTFINAELAGLYNVPGPAPVEPTAVTIRGGGVNIWGNADSFHFVSRTLDGDGEIVARVDTMVGGRSWAKAAVMIREELTATSRHAIATVSAQQGTAFKWRQAVGGATDYRMGPMAAAPYWVRLTRAGDVLTGFVSANGTSWTQVHQVTLPGLPQRLFAGVAYTNEDDTRQATATFSSIKVSGLPAGAAWSARDVGSVATPGVSTLSGPDAYQASTFRAEEDRVGLFAFSGMLARASKVSATSPTARGLFVRERLLCDHLPPPPPDVDTTLPPETGTAPKTMRERLEQHRTNPACSGCHSRMDPIGLALERYDALGQFRTTEHGITIDISGEAEGVKFQGLPGLMQMLRSKVKAQRCLAKMVYRSATGHVETWDEEATIREISDPLVAHGASYFDVLLAVVSSDGFRLAERSAP